MHSKPPISYINIRAFVHATEDLEKVLQAIRNLLSEELIESTTFQKDTLKGHHGNPIILLKTKLTDKKAFPTTLRRIGYGLNSLDKEDLQLNLKSHLEKTNLYLRFDKQSAFQNEIRFSQDDPIHFKIHFKNKTAMEIAEICREAGLLP